MANNWTDEQREVIESREGSLLVSAAAGSGKTAVLVERIIRMITDPEHPCDIDRMLVMTFTRAAASEIKERIRAAILKELEKRPEDARLEQQAILSETAQICTIDSFCKWLLEQNVDRADIDPAFRIVNEDELSLTREDVMKDMLEEYYASGREDFRDFADLFIRGKTDANLEELIWQVATIALSTPWPGEWIENCRRDLLEEDEESAAKSRWVCWLISDTGDRAGDWEQLLMRAVSLANEPEGPGAYLPALESDLSFVRALREAGDYDRIKMVLDSYAFPRLAAIRGNAVNQASKKLVQSIRDMVKKASGKMREEFFAFPLREALGRRKEGILLLLELSGEFLKRYREAKREKNILDFGDLEHEALLLLSTDEQDHRPGPAADEAAKQFEWILVDEYQDSNQVQEELINFISRKRFGTPNVIMVGDVKQSIYRFRLAKPELFVEKYHRFTSSGPERKIELHRNFRSRPEVLDTVNDIFRRVMTRGVGSIDYTDDAALCCGASFPERTGGEGPESELILMDSGPEAPGAGDADAGKKELEADLIAERIRELTNPETGFRVVDKETKEYRPACYKDIVILLRAVSGWGEEFAEELLRRGIPAVSESRTGFFDAREVGCVLDLLSVVDNPFNDIPLAASLLAPFGGLSEEELAAVTAEDKKEAKPDHEGGFYRVVRGYLLRHQEVPDETALKLKRFFSLVSELKAASACLSMPDLLAFLYEKTGYYRYASALPGGETRRANLDMLIEKAKELEETGYRGIFQFIRYVEKIKKVKTKMGEASVPSPEGNQVRIVSIHKSKGLEFPIVFAAGLGKQFNNMDFKNSFFIDADDGIAGDEVSAGTREVWPTLKKNVMKRRLKLDSLGEELRMLYVALTRAKEKLILTAAVDNPAGRMEKWSGMASGEGPLPGSLIESAQSMLDWVLMASAGGNVRVNTRIVNPENLILSEVSEQGKKKMAEVFLREMDMSRVYEEKTARTLADSYDFSYPFEAETRMNMKLSVSELKKEHMEELEKLAGEEEQPEKLFGPQGVTPGAAAGTAFHRAMELIPFDGLCGEDKVREKLREFREEGRLDEETFSLIRPESVSEFLQSGLGRRAQTAWQRGKLKKEQQFVIGIPAREAGRGDSDERILIQGIIDAFFEEDGELVLYDYKTDRVSSPEELSERYRVQIEYYRKALEQITGMKVKESWLWSVRFGAVRM